MSKNKLTKVEALKLIAPVVDNEVKEEEREAFLQYISNHDDVRRKYESMQKIKALVALRCPRAKAPDSLKNNISKIIADSERTDTVNSKIEPDNSATSNSTSQRSNIWKYAAAASILMVISVWIFIQYSSFSTQDNPVYNVEEYAFEHFKKHHGRFVAPTISTASVGSAETELINAYHLSMTVPGLKNADFKGIVYADFVPGFKAPMLEYYLPAEDEYVYIFAFNLDRMKEFNHLSRNEEAIIACDQPKDFYICNINGKHVVSWKWDNTWYAAISNQNGKTLASLVKPLDYSLNNDK